MSQPKYKLEDVVYYVTVNWTAKQVPCPDCHGHKRWSAILPAGEEMLIECPTCWAGYDGCRGTIDDWDFRSHVHECEVAGLTRNGSGFEYVIKSLRCNATYRVDETEIYLAHADAVAVGKSEVIRVSQEKRTHQARQLRSKRKDHVASRVAYWKKEIREAKKRIAQAEKALDEINSVQPQVII